MNPSSSPCLCMSGRKTYWRGFAFFLLCLSAPWPLMAQDVTNPAPSNPAPSNPALFDQKAGIVERYLNKSNASHGGTTATGGTMALAADKHRLALAAKQAGRLDEALKLLDESLKLALQASKANADPSSKNWYYKAQYEDLLDAVTNFRETYARHQSRIQLKEGDSGALDLSKVDALMGRAQQLYAQNRFQEARDAAANAKNMLVSALKGFMDSKTIIYEQNFEKPSEAYKYKLDLSGSLESLLRTALSENNVEVQAREKIKSLAVESRASRDKAVSLAADGDLQAAVSTMDQANGLLMEALRLTGSVVPF